MSKVTESIFDGESCVIPMADVSFIEKHWISTTPKAERTKSNWHGIQVIMKYSFWDMQADTWAHNAYLDGAEAKRFLQTWCRYRHELEEVNAT